MSDTRDIVERLRWYADGLWQCPDEVLEQAASEIARLREERRQREALWTACADRMQLVYGSALRPTRLPPGPEGDA